MNRTTSSMAFSISGVIVSILFAGNVFFIKRMVDKLDQTEQTVWELRQQIAVMRMAVDDLKLLAVKYKHD